MSQARVYIEWLRAPGRVTEAEHCLRYVSRSALGAALELPGPAGERNVDTLRPRGAVAALAGPRRVCWIRSALCWRVGIRHWSRPARWRSAFAGLPAELAACIDIRAQAETSEDLRAVLFEGETGALLERELQTALGLVVAEAGICLVPAAVEQLRRDQLAYRPLDEEAAVSPIFMSSRKADPSPEVALILDLIRAVYAKEGIAFGV